MIKNYFFKLGTDQKYEASVSFKIVNSKTGDTILNPTIYLNDEIVTYTFASNTYTIIVPIKGIFTIKITKEDYTDLENTYSFNTLKNASLSMVPIQTTGEMNIAVSWDHSQKRDIDSHMCININGSKKYIYYSSSTYEDINTKVSLDRDDTGQDTGENTTITPVYPGYSYHFWLEDYGKEADATGFADRAVTVTITYNNVTTSYTTPAGSKGKYWDIFTITNGNVNLINTYTNTDPKD